MNGFCTTNTHVLIQDILDQTPSSQIAMFEIISIPATAEDWCLGEHVYIHNGNVYDFVADEQILGLKAQNLHFIRYIDR